LRWSGSACPRAAALQTARVIEPLATYRRRTV
jgi:hypothetical protein